ncbi:MAG TPA: glycosyltransferase family 4 protein, partial [Parafilimonas sp.]|nr:glycosyltransferase family 4 protein [Parafilimonas sp.]
MHILPVTPADNNSINVLEIIGNASVGGMENYIKNFLVHLPPGQFRISCICPYESAFTQLLRELGVENVFITPVEDDPKWRSIQLAMEVAKLHDIQLLHAHMPKAHVLAGVAGNLLNKPVVATIHGMDVTAHEFGVARAVKSHLITNCQEAYIQALAMGVPAERVNVVSNGIDVNVFKTAANGDKFRKAANIPAAAQLVGFVGRFEYEKGPDLFVYAAQYIHQYMPDVHFIMVGEGEMQKELTKLGTRFRLQKNLHFVDWCENLAEAYAALDILAHPSRSDGTSLVLLEAMACGKPAAGFSVGGIREIIENRNTGLLAPVGDWEALARRIIQLLEQKPEQLKKMGEAAKARVQKHFNVKRNTLQTAQILRRIALSASHDQQFNLPNGVSSKKLSNGRPQMHV